jgi:hypothetical protein
MEFYNFSVIFSSVALTESGGNPPGDWQSAVGWGDAGFGPGTAGQQSGALPLSYHTSLCHLSEGPFPKFVDSKAVSEKTVKV